MGYLYVFIDESGNYDFSPSGTRYWLLTSVITDDIRPGVLDLYDLKHHVIDSGIDIEYFHATEDKQIVRNAVFHIVKSLDNIRIDTMVVDKRKVPPEARPLDRFYPAMMQRLLIQSFDAASLNSEDYDKVFFFLDRASSSRKEREALVAGVKQYIARHLRGTSYHITMHPSTSHHYLQIVDYVSWAIYVKWERNELRPWAEIAHLVKSETYVFPHNSKDWYR